MRSGLVSGGVGATSADFLDRATEVTSVGLVAERLPTQTRLSVQTDSRL